MRRKVFQVYKKWKRSGFRNTKLHNRYKNLKKEYHDCLKNDMKEYEKRELDEALISTSNGDMDSIYKVFKDKSGGCTVDIEKFKDFYQKLLNKHPKPIVKNILDVKEHPLLTKINEQEICGTIERIKSKAKSASHLSPNDIKKIQGIRVLLVDIFNHALETGSFPTDIWLESAIFFLYKKGEMDDPDNYRSINIQNPILKILTCLLAKRLSLYAEEQCLLPDFQLGYRKGMNTIGATSVIHNLIKMRFKDTTDNNNKSTKSKSLKTYVCFVDFSKCFDSINREKFYDKIQNMGIPFTFCNLLDSIYKGMKCHIRSGDVLAEPFTTTTGLPQGCGLSSIGFSLFVADLPNALMKLGQKINGKLVNYIQYADDLAIIARTKAELKNK